MSGWSELEDDAVARNEWERQDREHDELLECGVVERAKWTAARNHPETGGSSLQVASPAGPVVAAIGERPAAVASPRGGATTSREAA